MLSTILVWLVLGLVAGYVASLITSTREGMVTNIIVGVIGAFIGGMVLRLFGVNAGVTGLDLPSILTAILGAVILLGIVRAVSGNRRNTTV